MWLPRAASAEFLASRSPSGYTKFPIELSNLDFWHFVRPAPGKETSLHVTREGVNVTVASRPGPKSWRECHPPEVDRDITVQLKTEECSSKDGTFGGDSEWAAGIIAHEINNTARSHRNPIRFTCYAGSPLARRARLCSLCTTRRTRTDAESPTSPGKHWVFIPRDRSIPVKVFISAAIKLLDEPLPPLIGYRQTRRREFDQIPWISDITLMEPSKVFQSRTQTAYFSI